MLGSFSDMLSTGFCTTRHWQTIGRLVQELNVSTVCDFEFVVTSDQHLFLNVTKMVQPIVI